MGFLIVIFSVDMEEHTSDFSDKFKVIFDLCDVDKDGYIDVKHFSELAQDHFGAASTEVKIVLEI